MKLLLIITDYGSFNNFLSELAITIFNCSEIELVVICSDAKVININDKESFARVKIRYVEIPRKITLVGEWKAAKAIRKVVDFEKPDLIHAHFTTATFPTILLKKRKFTYWATIHGLGMNSSSGIKKIIFTIVELLCFYRLNKIFTVNEQDYSLVNKLFKNKAKKYDCLGFGCDITKFSLQSIGNDSIKNLKIKHKISSNHIVLSYTGRFVSFKGFDLVVKTFKTLTELYPNKFKLILMGGVDPIHKTGLNQFQEEFFNTSEDVILTGFTNEVERYLAISDIFVFPSKKEGLPTCTLEALAVGLPVVTFDTRGNNDIIKSGYNGILIQPQKDKKSEIGDLVREIEQLVANPATRDLLRRNALNDRDSYSRDRFVDEQLQYYNEFRLNEHQ